MILISLRQAEETDFETLSGWEQLRYNAENGQFAVINKSGSVEDEDVFQLTLTAKEQAEVKETTITLKDISISEGKEDVFLKDTEFRMTVNSEEQPENGGGEGVPGEPDETPGDSENETEILPEDPEETQEIRNEVPDGTGELSGDESVEISTEQQSEEQERVQTGDTDAGDVLFSHAASGIPFGIRRNSDYRNKKEKTE